MPQMVSYSVLATCLALLIGGCGPERFGFTRETNATATPTPVPVLTFTPTPQPISQQTSQPVSQPTLTTASSAAVSEPSVPAADIAQSATQTVTVADPIATLPVATNSVGDAVVEDEASLLPTPTASPAADEAEAASDAVSETPDETVPADEARADVVVEAANVRNGPSTDYNVVGTVVNGEQYPVTGRNAQGDWWQICCFAEQPGWIYDPLVEMQNADLVAEVTDLPPLPERPTPAPLADTVPDEAAPPADAPGEPAPEAPQTTDTNAHSGTAGNFDPNAQYQIIHYRVLGFADNNGGIFNKGGQQLIFVTVLDQNGNGVDGAIVKDAVGDKLNVVTGSKGPGKAEIKMDWDPYKLYVAADPNGAVTSQISNQMNNPYPHIPDVIGMLGPPDNEYAICPTIDDRCTPPFYHAHWSYEITFQRVK